MSNCCERRRSDAPIAKTNCPTSGTEGAPVELHTVRALLTMTALQRLEIGGYRFCRDPACDVVYFDEQGHTFSTADIRVPVWQKQPEGDRVLCYCFGETESNMRDEIAAAGFSDAAERVRSHIQAGRCACEVRNPRGSCCLGDIMAALNRLGSARRSSGAEAV